MVLGLQQQTLAGRGVRNWGKLRKSLNDYIYI